MKKLLFALVIAASLVACQSGPTAAEKAKRDSIVADSIAKVKADSVAAIVEKAKQDSITASVEKARQDSIAKAADKKGGKKKK